jgi:hypothetical protein
LGTDLYHRNQDVTKFTNEIAEKEAGIAKYDYLPEMAARIALLEEIVKKVKDDQERRDKLRNISNEIHEFSSKQNQCMVIINRWFNLEGNEKFVNGIAAQNDRMNILGHLQNEYEHAIYHGQQCALTINRWRDIDLSEKCIDLVLANQKKKADLVYIQFEYQTKYRQIQEANEILAKWTNLETAEPLLSGIMPAVQKRDGFIRKRSELANAEFTVSHYQKDLQRLASIGQAEELINAAENTKDRRSHMNELCYAYGQAHSSAENLRVNLEGREKQLTRFETDYQDTLMSLNICPTCGQEICKHKVV